MVDLKAVVEAKLFFWCGPLVLLYTRNSGYAATHETHTHTHTLTRLCSYLYGAFTLTSIHLCVLTQTLTLTLTLNNLCLTPTLT